MFYVFYAGGKKTSQNLYRRARNKLQDSDSSTMYPLNNIIRNECQRTFEKNMFGIDFFCFCILQKNKPRFRTPRAFTGERDIKCKFQAFIFAFSVVFENNCHTPFEQKKTVFCLLFQLKKKAKHKRQDSEISIIYPSTILFETDCWTPFKKYLFESHGIICWAARIGQFPATPEHLEPYRRARHKIQDLESSTMYPLNNLIRTNCQRIFGKTCFAFIHFFCSLKKNTPRFRTYRAFTGEQDRKCKIQRQ